MKVGEKYTPSEGVKDPAVARELARIAQVLATFSSPSLEVLHVAPEKPYHGQTVICDGDDWDPLSDDTLRPVWYDAVAGTWKAFG